LPLQIASSILVMMQGAGFYPRLKDVGVRKQAFRFAEQFGYVSRVALHHVGRSWRWAIFLVGSYFDVQKFRELIL
jgi:hypothetical protein